MGKLNFKVQGSASEPYEVTFEKQGNELMAFCTCPAGENGQHCKHRINILEGDPSSITSGNESKVAEVVRWLKGTRLEKILIELNSKEKQAEALKKEIMVLKKKLASSFRGAA